MFIDDWTTQATRSLWYTLQEENPQALLNVLGNDMPTLYLACERLRTWIAEKRMRIPKIPDTNFILEREMVSCALDEVDWEVLTFRIAQALNIPIRNVSDSIICPKCHWQLCQMCMLCINPSCENGHEVDCLSESNRLQFGPIRFDFTDRKLVIYIGDYTMPVSDKDYKRLYNWLDIRKDG